jgi:hypothetical protein
MPTAYKTPLSSVSICVHLWSNSDSEIKPFNPTRRGGRTSIRFRPPLRVGLNWKPGSEPPSIPSNSSESRSMATQSEQILEDNLVTQLIALGYEKVDVTDVSFNAGEPESPNRGIQRHDADGRRIHQGTEPPEHKLRRLCQSQNPAGPDEAHQRRRRHRLPGVLRLHQSTAESLPGDAAGGHRGQLQESLRRDDPHSSTACRWCRSN